MNKYIEEYIAQRKKEIEKEKQITRNSERADIFKKLGIGREYYDDHSNEPASNFPYWDDSVGGYYRYNFDPEDISDEEFEELLKYIPNDEVEDTHSSTKMSFWYYFALMMVFIGCVSGVYVGSKVDSFTLTIGIIYGTLVLSAIIILLSKIEYNTRAKK